MAKLTRIEEINLILGIQGMLEKAGSNENDNLWDSVEAKLQALGYLPEGTKCSEQEVKEAYLCLLAKLTDDALAQSGRGKVVYQINSEALEQLRVAPDEDPDFYPDLIVDLKKNMAAYAQIVLSFQLWREKWQHDLSGEDYRQKFGDLDQRRSGIHDHLRQRLDLVNSEARDQGLPLIIDVGESRVQEVNRTDVANAILIWYQEQVSQELHK
ncbi:hypothetical protein [Lactobacillus equicursoris]|uniref:hypothetical protein n=1 Tax=Lactobacillus equicursoris TaxID=420645 RepID=UPI00242C1054|nr:hypothetical protein [Lactobacillus equicursoris]MDD6386371.1 hypothetical protein [Lactobacillus equicursoris]